MEKNEILMIYGKNYKDMTKELLTAAKLADQIGDKKKKIGLKPNLVVAKTPDSGATTHMEMVEGTIEYLQENGFKNISITEGSWVGDRTQAAYSVCGYHNVARKYGVDLIDNQKDTYKTYDCKGMKLNICDFPMSLDFEEGGNPVTMNRIMGFRDPVLCDAFVCETMGYNVSDVAYIGMAERLGVGCADISKAKIIELNEGCNATGKIRMTRRVQELAKYVEPVDACSACYGSLIYALDRLNDMGMLRKCKTKIAIGQGYKGKTGEIGVGQCTCGFAKSCKGCPPKAIDMVEFLKNEL